MSDKDHNGDMVNLLGPKKAKQVKKGAAKTKTLLVSNDRWVLVSSICILVFSLALVSLSGVMTQTKQEDIKQAMYTYEQQIFQKKIQIYREEYRVKGVEVEELNHRMELMEKELRDAYNQVGFANMQLEKASRMLGQETRKIKDLEKENHQYLSQIKKKQDTVEGLKDDLKEERSEKTQAEKSSSQHQEEERLLNKELRAKVAKIGHLEKTIETVKAKLKQSEEAFKTLKIQCTELEVKEQMEREEIDLLKDSLKDSINASEDDLEKELNELKDSLNEDNESDGGNEDIGDNTEDSGDTEGNSGYTEDNYQNFKDPTEDN